MVKLPTRYIYTLTDLQTSTVIRKRYSWHFDGLNYCINRGKSNSPTLVNSCHVVHVARHVLALPGFHFGMHFLPLTASLQILCYCWDCAHVQMLGYFYTLTAHFHKYGTELYITKLKDCSQAYIRLNESFCFYRHEVVTLHDGKTASSSDLTRWVTWIATLVC